MIVPPLFSILRGGPERQRWRKPSSQPTVSSKGEGDATVHGIEPTDLRFVGPVTAEVIERAPFDAAALCDRTVSYAELLEAGVNPGVAGKLRREYSLVWSFEWIAGANLEHRARNVGGLDADQRRWIASSSTIDDETRDRRDRMTDAERAWRERSAWVNGSGSATCERCGEELVTLRLGGSQSVQCEACGYVGVSVRF